MVFKVILEEEEEGGYSVHCPELPGCHSQGETVEEALANVREAIECYLESLKKDNLTLHKKQVVVEEIEVAV
jgi:predicted RNase H-like HicB family nuclease